MANEPRQQTEASSATAATPAATAAATAIEEAPQKITIRHILIVITGCLITFAPATMVFNTWSIMLVPVCEELGATASQFTLFPSLMFLCASIASPFMGKALEKFDLRLVIGGCVCLIAAGLLLNAQWQVIWGFYLSGALMGVGVVVCMFLASACLVTRWFNSHTGLLIGVCVAFSGIGGAVWTMVGGYILSVADWRTAYLVFGAAVLIIALPPTLLFVRSHPSDLGLRPYGIEPPVIGADEGDNSISASRAFKMPLFYFAAGSIALLNGAAQFGNFFPKYVYHLSDLGMAGITPAAAIIMASIIAACLSISQGIGKVTLGIIVDKSVDVAMILSCICGVVGVLLLRFGAGSTLMIYAAPCFYGIVVATTAVLGAAIIRVFFGSRDHAVIYSRATSMITFAPAVCIVLFGIAVDAGWDTLFLVIAIVWVIIIACTIGLLYLRRKMVRDVTATTASGQ